MEAVRGGVWIFSGIAQFEFLKKLNLPVGQVNNRIQ